MKRRNSEPKNKREEEIKKEFNDNGEEIVRVPSERLMNKFRSKEDIYNFLTMKYQLLIPPNQEIKLSCNIILQSYLSCIDRFSSRSTKRQKGRHFE